MPSESAEEYMVRVAAEHQARQAATGMTPHLDPRTEPARKAHEASLRTSGVKPTVVKGVDQYTPDARGSAIMAHLYEGEPWFVFRAHDILSSFALDAYLTLIEKFNPDSPQVESCTEMVNAFRRWQQANPSLVKLPD